MFYPKNERPLVMQALLNKGQIEITFDRIRKKLAEMDTEAKSFERDDLDYTEKLIVEGRKTYLADLMFFIGILEATVFNIAEQNERLTKLIQTSNLPEVQQQVVINDLRNNIEKAENEIRELRNDPVKKWLDDYIKHSSETTKE